MEIIKKFFTETPTIIELFYIIAGVSLGGSLLFHCLPEEEALKWFMIYRGYSRRQKEFDWTATLRNQVIFLFSIFIYSVIILCLSFLLSEEIAETGGVILAVLVFITIFWLKPVKK